MSHVKIGYFVLTQMNNYILLYQMHVNRIKLQLTCILSCLTQPLKAKL